MTSSVGSVSAPFQQRGGSEFVIDGAVEGLKMETKWGAIVGTVVGAAVGLTTRNIAGVAGGAAAGAAIGAASIALTGLAHGAGAGIANAIGKPSNAQEMHNNSVVGGAAAGATIGLLGGLKNPAALAGGVSVGGLWGGLMGHFIANRMD